MSMFTKLVWVVTYCTGLPSIKPNNPSVRWFCEFTWQIKYNFISICRRQCAVLLWEGSHLKAAWSIDHNVRSRENLKKIMFLLHKTYMATKPDRMLSYGKIFIRQTLKMSPVFLIHFLLFLLLALWSVGCSRVQNFDYWLNNTNK